MPPSLFSDNPVPVSELHPAAMAIAAVLGLSLACVVYQCCAKPILDEQDFKIKKARMEAKKAMSKKK